MTVVPASPPPISPEGRVIGLDLGTRRIGVAVTDGNQRVATGVTFIGRSGDVRRDHQAVAAVVVEYEAVGVVVGLPRSLSGALGPAARQALSEINALRGVLDLPIESVDERFTTVTAAAGMRAAGRSARKQRPVIDQTAAAVALQSWLDRRSMGTGIRPGG